MTIAIGIYSDYQKNDNWCRLLFAYLLDVLHQMIDQSDQLLVPYEES